MPHTANPPPHRRAHPAESPQARTATTAPNPNPTPLPNLTKLLRLVQILLTYGRHLVDTFDQRSLASGFHLIARAFGTGRPAIILAHLRRGILRAAALERVLLERAATGRDLTPPPLRLRTPPPPQPAATQPPESPPARKQPPRPSWRDDWLDNVDDPLDPRHLPTFEHLLQQARRRPLGRSLGDIYSDLGIAPALCQAAFWNELFMTMMQYDGSPAIYDLRRWRREQQFEQEQERSPTLDLTWPQIRPGGGRGHIVQVLGFFIGEPPVEPPALLPREPALSAPPAPASARPQAAWATPRLATGPP